MIYIDGQIYEKNEEARISVFDHGLLYGDGVFEGIRVYNGRIFRLNSHLHRLFASARTIRLEIPGSAESLAEVITDMVRRSGKREAYIRLVVTRGTGDLGLDPRKCPKPSLIIIIDGISLYPKEFYEQGIRICTSSWRRPPPDCMHPRVKSLNYLNNILAKIEANDRGCQEALILNKEGRVAECTADNIFHASDGILFTPDLAEGALAGITRAVVLELAGGLGLEVSECRVSLFELYNAEEVFLTGSGAELVPVIEIDGRTIGSGRPGPVTDKIREAFKREISK
jgi:branched-chain amino acid aminotransferase